MTTEGLCGKFTDLTCSHVDERASENPAIRLLPGVMNYRFTPEYCLSGARLNKATPKSHETPAALVKVVLSPVGLKMLDTTWTNAHPSGQKVPARRHWDKADSIRHTGRRR
jgi:hypothetical protein